MAGSATLTTVESTVTTAEPMMQAISTMRLRCGLTAQYPARSSPAGGCR